MIIIVTVVVIIITIKIMICLGLMLNNTNTSNNNLGFAGSPGGAALASPRGRRPSIIMLSIIMFYHYGFACYYDYYYRYD